LPFLGAEAVACELSREAIFWALLALREQAASSNPSQQGDQVAAPGAPTLTTLWSETPPALLEQAAEGAAALARVRTDLLDKSFADFAELPPAVQKATAERAHAFGDRLIGPLALPQRAQERAWVRRMQLLMVGLVVLVGLGFALRALKQRHDLTLDFAPSASWVASSRFEPECTCHSPEQSCASCPNFFFCTANENHPSIEFDLHQVRSLSAVVVDNRLDCCFERAVPLVVQVSSDHKHWKTVATHKEEFISFRADFPTEQARWVKLYVARHDFLHLARVRLLP